MKSLAPTHTAGRLTRLLAAALLSLGLGTALADRRVPGTYTYYSASRDPISDVNTGVVSIDEQYDEEGNTAIVFRCANAGEADLWAYLISKNTLLSAEDADSGVMPGVVMRLGSDMPITVGGASLLTVSNARDELRTDRLGFSATMTRAMINGLNSGKKLVIRINRTAGGQPLTYSFPARGFKTAWAAVKQCR